MMKKNYYSMIAFVFAALLTNAQIPTNGLQLNYLFNGNIADSSGNANHATATGTYSFADNDLESTTDSCFKSNGEYELYYDYAANPTNFHTQNFTCVLWLKLDSFPNTYINLMENGAATTNSVYFRLLNAGNYGRIQAGHYNVTTNTGFISDYNVNIPQSSINAWHKLAYVSELNTAASIRVNKLYFDSAMVQSDTVTSNTTIVYDASYSRLNIGHRAATLNFGVLGNIDNFAYYNRALSDSEMLHFLNPTLGIDDEFEASNIGVFPNPANNFITISNVEIGSSISVFDVAGSLVFNTTPTNNTNTKLSTNSFADGLYILRIVKNGNIVNKKFIVSK